MVAKSATTAVRADKWAATRARRAAEFRALPAAERARGLRDLIGTLEMLGRHPESSVQQQADIAAGLAVWRPMLAATEAEIDAGRCPHCGRCDG